MKPILTILFTLALCLTAQAPNSFRSPAFLARIAAANGAAGGGGGGSPAWYDIGTVAEGDTEASENTGTMSWGSFVTAGQTGNVTKLRIYIHSGGTGDNFKMALYPAGGGNPITSGTAAVASVPAYLEVSVTPAGVTASTTYIIAWACDAVAGPASWYLNGSGTWDFATQTYSGFPPSPLPGTAGTFTRKYAVSMYVEP